MHPGCTLVCGGREVYLIDADGCVVHKWRSSRNVFVAYLLPNGNLIRDGSENDVAVGFQAGGASGFVEEVTWNNELVWSYAALPYDAYLTHHDMEPMPNGNLLLLCWERKTKEEALQAGRRPELLPDGELWNERVLEIAPDGKGGASVVWTWSLWDHLVQDYDKAKDNYGRIVEHPELFDINYCPPGGKSRCRNQDTGSKTPSFSTNNTGLTVFTTPAEGKTGERDWNHINSVSYNPETDQIVMSFNVASEYIVIEHTSSSDEASSHEDGKYGHGGDVLYRHGNPQTHRRGSRMDQTLFNQHCAHFVPSDCPGAGNVLLFNNGRAPDRHWSTVDEFALSKDLDSPSSKQVWGYGPRVGRERSFYCTHISGCQRLPNGNTLITHGPQGMITEVTPEGQEVWRFLSPIMCSVAGVEALVRQGDSRPSTGKFAFFRTLRYSLDFSGFDGKTLDPLGRLEA
eukprot:TRINITY_DN21717_c0_g1_i2.p1 TRINITY_DN21717_c0_g1~~TRINITY_DN21717_c0_g1_i2.p1  ORF type:complete len:457 (+),score=62.13 TRINITY_DN21717_c0_g1_i2:106-1476(+)